MPRILQLAFTLAAARNMVGPHTSNWTEALDLIQPSSVATLEDAVSALSAVLTFEVCLNLANLPACIDAIAHSYIKAAS